jgi:alpha-methylacyl-CoA racemase
MTENTSTAGEYEESASQPEGPLRGIRVLEFASLAPASFTGMWLSDMGAEIVRVDRADGGGSRAQTGWEPNFLHRGRRSIALDLKKEEGHAIARSLVQEADVVIEGFRPGVMERLKLGPSDCRALNPRVVYARITGWGQDGPLAASPGHDINYIALSGALNSFGLPAGQPVAPGNIVGDFAGGGMVAAFGIVCALMERHVSGEGQVVDAAMIDGSALLMTMRLSLRAAGWKEVRGHSVMTNAYWYDTYETSDGKYMAVGAVESQFYDAFCEVLGLNVAEWSDRFDRSKAAERRDQIAAIFKSRTQAEWEGAFRDSEACVSPVLSLDQAVKHEHNTARQTFVNISGWEQAAPVPRFSRTPARIQRLPVSEGTDSFSVLHGLGYSDKQIDDLVAAEAVRVRRPGEHAGEDGGFLRPKWMQD